MSVQALSTSRPSGRYALDIVESLKRMPRSVVHVEISLARWITVDEMDGLADFSDRHQMFSVVPAIVEW